MIRAPIPADDALPPEFRGLPFTLAAAREGGHLYYWNDGPCKRGHRGPHYAKNLTCVQCARRASKAKKKTADTPLADAVEYPYVHILGDWSPALYSAGQLSRVTFVAEASP